MFIKRLSLENIRSYESITIDFPKGSLLLSGDIGSGKTTILLSIEFALFGLQPGQRGSSLLRFGKDFGSVRLELDIDGKEIIIERGLERGSKTISQEEAFITMGGLREEVATSELKNRILKLLNYPIEFAKKTNLLYKFTVYTPQEEMKQIILEDSQTRLNAIRHVFGVNKYKNIKENVSLLSTYLREDIRNKEGVIRDLDDKKQQLDERKQVLKVLEKNFVDSQVELETFILARKTIEMELSATKTKIDEKKKLEQEIEKIKVAVLGKKELVTNMDKEITILNKEISDIKGLSFSDELIKNLELEKKDLEILEDDKKKENFDYIVKSKSLKARNMEINSLKERIMQIQLCPTCLQNVDNNYKTNIFRKFDDDLEKNLLIIKDCDQKIMKFDNDMSIIIGKRKDIERQFSQVQLNKLRISSMSDKENKLLDDYKRKESALKDVDMLSSNIDLLKDHIRELAKYDLIYSKTEEDFRAALKLEREADLARGGIAKEIQLTKMIIIEMSNEIKKKEDTKANLNKILEIYDWLSNQFSELVAFTERNVLIRLREEFSKLFNEWFNILVPENFSVSLDEDFTPIVYQHDYELDYAHLSGGERTAIALAYRLALNKTINSMLSDLKTKNLVILDEPTDGFSDQQLDKMRDVLNELSAEQLIIVSHENKIESFVDNVIKLSKEKGVSGVRGSEKKEVISE
ncbi:MAG: AAA family ATPase [Nanoarchaeota archaeon]